jgi:hypothetical protein
VEGRLLGAPRAGLIAEAEEIRRRAIEITPAAIDHAMLEQAGRVPGREFSRFEIRDLRADAVAGFLFAQGKVELDAMHALGFEFQRTALLGGQRISGEPSVDGGAGGFELAVVDVRDDVVEQYVMSAAVRGVACRARYAEQQRR